MSKIRKIDWSTEPHPTQPKEFRVLVYEPFNPNTHLRVRLPIALKRASLREMLATAGPQKDWLG
jgi:hypothetical protein